MPLVTRLSQQGTVYAQATAPTITQDCETWIDTDTGAVYTSENGDWVPFVCVLIPKTVFQDIGLVDLKYAEDVEFCLRTKSGAAGTPRCLAIP